VPALLALGLAAPGRGARLSATTALAAGATEAAGGQSAAEAAEAAEELAVSKQLAVEGHVASARFVDRLSRQLDAARRAHEAAVARDREAAGTAADPEEIIRQLVRLNIPEGEAAAAVAEVESGISSVNDTVAVYTCWPGISRR
jgi:hypothetical protein